MNLVAHRCFDGLFSVLFFESLHQSPSTVYRHIEELEKLEVIKPVGDGAKRYTLNRDDEIAEFLHKLEGVTLKRLLEKGE